ncbi:hypothetical protein WJX74_003848 [Apatococcus lobatus]|uniref:Uncharacterized protein n=1 Tax=Apatococcus lobatus TaxID=904363 RepID=A0AAW1RED1_9CHLO
MCVRSLNHSNIDHPQLNAHALFGKLMAFLLRLALNGAAGFLAYNVTRNSTDVPKEVRDATGNLKPLRDNMQYKLIASILIDLAGLGLIRGLLPGWLSFLTVFLTPIAVFLDQYLYNRPVLTLVDILEGTFPLANLVPAATLGWAIEQGYIGKDFFKVAEKKANQATR